MIDTDSMLRGVQNFSEASRPLNATNDAPCTVEDIQRVINNASAALSLFVEEIRKSQ